MYADSAETANDNWSCPLHPLRSRNATHLLGLTRVTMSREGCMYKMSTATFDDAGLEIKSFN